LTRCSEYLRLYQRITIKVLFSNEVREIGHGQRHEAKGARKYYACMIFFYPYTFRHGPYAVMMLIIDSFSHKVLV
jgi:hypothetical protein